mmetsp:Transcript_103504/g.198689  ORF Transcript_103504/g.198689 Transcript_103504/m.198689 type:complete len:182 (-) Transcript_103504:61-606(-)
MLDRQRLMKIEAMADEVLRTQEDLIMLDRQRNGRREALGCFRRGEVSGKTQWVAAEGQFLRLPTSTARDWLHRRQEATASEVQAARSRLKTQTKELLFEHPDATGLHPGVCELLLKEQRGQKEEEVAAPQAAQAGSGRSVANSKQQTREEQRKRNSLDYSRFDNIADSGSDSDHMEITRQY